MMKYKIMDNNVIKVIGCNAKKETIKRKGCNPSDCIPHLYFLF